MRRAVVAALAIATVAVGCFPQGTCESAGSEYCANGDQSCQGHIINATQWESGPIDGEWLSYGPEEVILMHLRDAVTGQVLTGRIVDVQGFVAADSTPNKGGDQWAPCAGNLCEFTQPDAPSSSFFVKNDTCAGYWFRVVITIDPGDGGTTDGAVE